MLAPSAHPAEALLDADSESPTVEAVVRDIPTRSAAAGLFLASQSPRRRELLRDAGFDFQAVNPPMDDAHLVSGRVQPRRWVEALAYLKARAAETLLASRGHAGVVIGADTIVLANNRILGKPESADEARAMIESLRNGEHQVLTGVSLVRINAIERRLLSDRATVRFGDFSRDQIDAHLASGAWRGKAGGYNIAELRAAGWPVEWSGDLTTVIGLPMQRLTPMLREIQSLGYTAWR